MASKKRPKSKISLSIDTEIVDKVLEISEASSISPSPSVIINYILRHSKKKFAKLRRMYINEKEGEEE